MYSEIPTDIILREIPVTDSDILNGNTVEYSVDKVAVPSFITGDSVEIVFSKENDDHVKVGGENIKVFDSSSEAWQEACYNAVGILNFPYDVTFHDDIVIEKAKELINSLDWWTDIH